jgi:hypothetical protein
MELMLIAALVVLIGVYVVVKKKNASSEATTRKAAPERRASQLGGEYHAVSVRTGRRACAAVCEIERQRFLSKDAPALPLPGCDIVDCECSYVHYKDRRSGHDRRSPFAPGGISGGTGTHERERREGSERRSEDQDDYF